MQHAFRDVSDEVVALAALGRQRQHVSPQELGPNSIEKFWPEIWLEKRLDTIPFLF